MTAFNVPIIAAILYPDEVRIAGAGYLLDDKFILTCAHVLYMSEWLKDESTAPDEKIFKVSLVLRTGRVARDAKLRYLAKKDAANEIPIIDDICVLELTAPCEAGKANSYSLVDRAAVHEIDVSIFGFPRRWEDSGNRVQGSTNGLDARGVVFLNRRGDGSFIEEGFSGAPVIDEAHKEVLGIVVAARGESRAYMLPVRLIDQKCKLSTFSSELRIKNAVEGDYPHLATLRDFAEERRKLSKHGLFPQYAAQCPTYEELTALHLGDKAPSTKLRPLDLVQPAAANKVYIQAPGGIGKTNFLMGLILAAIDNGLVPFYLDVSSVAKVSEANEDGLRNLFEQSSHAGGRFDEFTRAARTKQNATLLVVDGLNESSVSIETLTALLAFAGRYYPNLSVLVADRMLRARALPDGFSRATILPINLDEIAFEPAKTDLSNVTNAKFRRLLSIPFFLNLYLDLSGLSGPAAQAGRATMLKDYFQEYGVADDARLGILAEVSFAAYEHSGVRINADLWRQSIDKTGLSDVHQHLVDSGILVEHGNDVMFRHQLFHDFLAALHLSLMQRTEWSGRALDIATLKGKSVEALELASELLTDKADSFVVEVYDWNYSAAIDCIINLDAGQAGDDSPLSPLLKDAIFAINSEKLFDHFEHTRGRMRVRVEGFHSGTGITFSSVSSQENLIQQVRDGFAPAIENASEDIRRWYELFTLAETPNPRLWSVLQDTPLIGWTAANVFRRFLPKAGDLAAYLIGLYETSRRVTPTDEKALTLRWRVVHALGAVNDEPSRSLLQKIVQDNAEGRWVRFGAVRSLVEIASKSDEATSRALLEGLIVAMPTLKGTVAFGEVRDVAIIASSEPNWWPKEYLKVLEYGHELVKDDREEASRWQQRIQDLQKRVGG